MTQTATESHPARTSLEIAASARTAQLAIRARLLRDVTALWPTLDAKRLAETWPGWLRAMSLLIRNYHSQSSVAASAAYRAARQAATQSPAPSSLVKLAPQPSEEWLRKALGYSGPGMLKWDKARPNTALSTTLGTASRVALDGGRTTTLDTIKADPAAKGWYRVTDGQPCAFCAMLASRGVVYKGHSFDKSDPRFHGPGEFKVHNDCGCSLAPAFSRSHETLPDLNRTAATVWSGATDGVHYKQALQAFRKAWNDHLVNA
ncbi:MAG TPA: hypothetical protein VFH56_10980 [Acidimicrobiales bacterium]|nr:hypothetical protein [Acidimicrobiales bacterium]